MMSEILSQFTTQSILSYVGIWLPKIFSALVILLVFSLFYYFTKRPLIKILGKAKFDESLSDMLVENVYGSCIVIIGIVTALSQAGVNVGAALAGIGVIGIAVGLAAQDSLSNFIAGFLIFWDRPFKVGEWISLGGLYGSVVEITMRSTRIRTKENTYIVIPNQKIINEVLINHSKRGMTRVNLPIGIAYKESIPKAREVLLDAVKDVPHILTDPVPDVVVEKINESSIDLLVRVWTEDAKNERDVFYSGLETCKLALDKAGIQIPFPHRQLFIDKVDKDILDKFQS
jgi:small conductance mechanosensitive channel